MVHHLLEAADLLTIKMNPQPKKQAHQMNLPIPMEKIYQLSQSLLGKSQQIGSFPPLTFLLLD